jgi:hypothetical protein
MARDLLYNDGRTTLQDLTIFGNEGLIPEDPGELMTDIFGLSTVTTVWKCPIDRRNLIPPMLVQHPIYTFANMERRRIQMGQGYLIITGDFAGVEGTTSIPIYELCIGVADEPIVTHPKFAGSIGGTPSDPLNGAIFLGPDGQVSSDNETAQFAYFNHSTNFVGIESYLAADQMTWRERYVSRFQPNASNVGYINFPPGGPPGASNWIQISANFEQRGLSYFITNEWRAGGRRGWNNTIYTR